MKKHRTVPIEMNPGEFRTIGHHLVDRIADLLDSLPAHPVTTGESPPDIRKALDASRLLPDIGTDPAQLMNHATDLLFDHSLFNSHPRFWGYITSAAAPIGILGDLLASAINQNTGAWFLSPMASEIEAQTVRWIAELLGFPTDCGGLLVSGGNMANIVCFLAARQAKAGWDVRAAGLHGSKTQQLRIYCSKETHTWVQKAADMTGIGTNNIRWIPTDKELRMDIEILRDQIRADKKTGEQPFIVIGTAGSVSTGAIDDLEEISKLCREEELWFHVDGAYGGFAAMLPDASPELRALSQADSVAVDPHKWLYAPLEAGCALVRDPEKLREAFAYHPPYYHFGVEAINYLDYGPQNSRGFRALKVWLALQQAGRKGYEQMLADDIQLAKTLHELVAQKPELEAFTHSLSITTFRHVPSDLKITSDSVEEYLNQLNTELLTRLQNSGEAYLSNAVIDGKFTLRACIVNFRSSLADIDALPEIVLRIGREVDAELRPERLNIKG
ncbi:MAG: aminotransferase class V-fold PLP-dependent enzyme [Chloroflexi bacterium]|nr:MAG: aminotransferase class V-fold PLP-dependent enzyme [Chloroflexota bacterium]